MLKASQRSPQLLVPVALLALLLFQAYAYWDRLTLSLGPIVILQPLLMRQGYLIYEQIVDEHSPLMYYLLSALVPAFPDGPTLASTFLVTLISLSTLLTFLATQRTAGALAGLAAALFFASWSPIFGFGKLWHETLLAPIYALFLLLYSSSGSQHYRKSLLGLSLLGGVAILVKQHAVAVAIAFLVWTVLLEWQSHHSFLDVLATMALTSLGILLPILTYGVYHYLRAGTLENLLYWTVGFSLGGSYISLAAQSPNPNQIATLFPAYLLLPLALYYVAHLKRTNNETWQKYGWGLILLVTSSLTAYPRFHFFHLQSSLPVLAWLSASTLAYALHRKEPIVTFGARLRALAPIAIFLWSVASGFAVYQAAFAAVQPRKIWEYSDLIPLARATRQQIGPTDCFYIFPDDEATANLYYLTQCSPPRFWILTYPWFMLEPIKKRILLTLAEHPPQWIIYTPGRWDIENRAPEIITYIRANYQFVTQLPWAQGEVKLLKRKP